MRNWTRLRRLWKRSPILFLSQTLLVLIQTGALTYSVYLLREQTKDIENAKSNRSADFIFRFNEHLEKSPFLQLGFAIQRHKPILRENGGKFSEDELQEYLDLWEGLNDEYVTGLISKEMFYNAYSNALEDASDNAEVEAFIKQSQQESPEFYTGFEHLVKEMKAFRPSSSDR